MVGGRSEIESARNNSGSGQSSPAVPDQSAGGASSGGARSASGSGSRRATAAGAGSAKAGEPGDVSPPERWARNSGGLTPPGSRGDGIRVALTTGSTRE